MKLRAVSPHTHGRVGGSMRLQPEPTLYFWFFFFLAFAKVIEGKLASHGLICVSLTICEI